MNLDKIILFLKPQYNQLLQFQFTIVNPLFWVMLVLLFLLGLKFWDKKKAVSFSISLGVVLLIGTKIEDIFSTAISRPGTAFDPIILRLIFGVFAAIVIIYYFFIKSDSAY